MNQSLVARIYYGNAVNCTQFVLGSCLHRWLSVRPLCLRSYALPSWTSFAFPLTSLCVLYCTRYVWWYGVGIYCSPCDLFFWVQLDSWVVPGSASLPSCGYIGRDQHLASPLWRLWFFALKPLSLCALDNTNAHITPCHTTFCRISSVDRLPVRTYSSLRGCDPDEYCPLVDKFMDLADFWPKMSSAKFASS